MFSYMVMAEGVKAELSSVKVHVVVTVVTVAVSLTRVWHHTEATTGVSPAEAFPLSCLQQSEAATQLSSSQH